MSYIDTKPFLSIMEQRYLLTYKNPTVRSALRDAINSTITPWCLRLQMDSRKNRITEKSKHILEILEILWSEDKKDKSFNTDGIIEQKLLENFKPNPNASYNQSVLDTILENELESILPIK